MSTPPDRAGAPALGRCRCGHFATDHMAVAAIPGSASFRLEPTGPCRRCGEAACRRMSAQPTEPVVPTRTPRE